MPEVGEYAGRRSHPLPRKEGTGLSRSSVPTCTVAFLSRLPPRYSLVLSNAACWQAKSARGCNCKLNVRLVVTASWICPWL
eukprot:70990-Chlamydomonas_euryale.AAC.6